MLTKIKIEVKARILNIVLTFTKVRYKQKEKDNFASF